ncbi:MAG: hypothetical protein IJO74_06750 [Clostridia bacterium]|nr:hypothetical protein [Clostridia bacterium]
MDDFAKKLNDFGQSALKGAKKLKDVAAVGIDIAAEESQLKDYYVKLGKLYYRHHAQNPDSEMSELCRIISNSEEKLCKMRKQLSSLKGTEICDGCGKEIKSDLVFCPYCGKETVVKNEIDDIE